MKQLTFVIWVWLIAGLIVWIEGLDDDEPWWLGKPGFQMWTPWSIAEHVARRAQMYGRRVTFTQHVCALDSEGA